MRCFYGKAFYIQKAGPGGSLPGPFFMDKAVESLLCPKLLFEGFPEADIRRRNGRKRLEKGWKDTVESGQAPRWEPLSKTCRVLVTKAHGFTTDTLLLADFAAPKKGERAADFGTGCGTIPLLWRLRGEGEKLYGIELQEEAACLARRSVEENGFSGEVEILLGDVRKIEELLPAGSLDLIACNPPYWALDTGEKNREEGRSLCRHEISLSLMELAAAAKRTLRFGGRLCISLRPERLCEAMVLFQKNRLEPKRLRVVQQNRRKAPSLFLLECRSGGKPGLLMEPVFMIEEETGEYSPEMKRTYGEYREAGSWRS